MEWYVRSAGLNIMAINILQLTKHLRVIRNTWHFRLAHSIAKRCSHLNAALCATSTSQNIEEKLKLEFFSLSEYCIYNIDVICYFYVLFAVTHFYITSLSGLTVFNVQIPDKDYSLLGYPFVYYEFAFNYFYSLYAEYVEWRASHVSELELGGNITKFQFSNHCC